MTPNELVWPPTDEESRAMIVLHRVYINPECAAFDEVTGGTIATAHMDVDDCYTSILLTIPPNLVQDETRRVHNLDFNSISDPEFYIYIDVYGSYFPPGRHIEMHDTTFSSGITLNVIGLHVRTETCLEPEPINTTTTVDQPQRQPQSATAITPGQETAAVTKGKTNENRRVIRSQKRKAEEQPEAESSTAQKRKIEKQPEVKPTPRRKLEGKPKKDSEKKN